MQFFKITCFLAACVVSATSIAYANAPRRDHMLANAALRNLHDLAAVTAEYGQATKDSDAYGRYDAYSRMQKAAHDALVDMHSMSLTPEDSIHDVSKVLRISHLIEGGLSDGMFTNSQLIIVGQAILALRYDYAIGDQNWYAAMKGGGVMAKNPLRYAQELRDKGYSWVSVRPKGRLFLVETDWRSEMASNDVNDPALPDSGGSLKAVEVDYRQDSDDSTATVYFYRTKVSAEKAAQELKRKATTDAKTAAKLKAKIVAWRNKLTSLPYLIADKDNGFKIIYNVCKDTGKKDADGFNVCSDKGSYDWSQRRAIPYQWFGNLHACEHKEIELGRKKPEDVKISHNEEFITVCVPASKPNEKAMEGYKAIFALIAPGATDEDSSYAELRRRGHRAARIFRTFKACDDAESALYPKVLNDLGVDKDGNLVGNRSKSVDLTANCVRAY